MVGSRAIPPPSQSFVLSLCGSALRRRRNKWQQVSFLPDKFHFVSRNDYRREFELVPLLELDYNGNGFFLFPSHSLSLFLSSFLLCNFDYCSYNMALCERLRCGRFEMHLHLICEIFCEMFIFLQNVTR